MTETGFVTLDAFPKMESNHACRFCLITQRLLHMMIQSERCFMTWRAQAAKDKQDEHRAIQLLSRLTRKKEVQALMSWREVASGMVADEAKLRRACGALLHSAEARAFGLWRDTLVDENHNQAAVAAAVATPVQPTEAWTAATPASP